MRILVTACCLIFTTLCAGQTIVIRGEAPEYAGDTLTFYTYSDLLTRTHTPVAVVPLHGARKFDITAPLADTGIVFTENKLYHIYFYASPGHTYTLYFPPAVEETPDTYHPFYTPPSLQAGVESSDPNDINRLVAEDAPAGDTTYMVFKRYNDALDKYRSTATVNARSYIVNYFRDRPVHYYCEPYMQLLGEIYNNYINFQLLKLKTAVTTTINEQKGLAAFKQVLLRDAAFLDNAVTELAILSVIYNGLHGENYSVRGLLALAKEIQQSSTYPVHRVIAGNIISATEAYISGR